MNSATHTPGPWECDPSVSDGAFTIYAPEGWVICDRLAINHRAPESSANGFLIVEAPNMLVALKVAMNHLDDGHPGQHQCAEMIRTIIAKAEGRT